jgi:hypothetical protein
MRLLVAMGSGSLLQALFAESLGAAITPNNVEYFKRSTSFSHALHG